MTRIRGGFAITDKFGAGMYVTGMHRLDLMPCGGDIEIIGASAAMVERGGGTIAILARNGRPIWEVALTKLAEVRFDCPVVCTEGEHVELHAAGCEVCLCYRSAYSAEPRKRMPTV